MFRRRMIPYTELVPTKEYIIETQYCSFRGTYCHTIIANSTSYVVMMVNGTSMLFFTYDRFMDVDPVKKVVK